jgi:hypothetical protein
MTPITLAVFTLGVALILVVALFVAAPLFGPVTPYAINASIERELLERQKRQALAAIKEVELDREMGKLSPEDFASQRARFENQALEAMAALDRRGKA